MSFILKSTEEILLTIALKSKSKRLELDLSQKSLSDKSGVSYGTLKKFENTGRISLESLLKIALVLDSLEEFENLFSNSDNKMPSSIDEIINKKPRQRGRK